VPRPYPQDKNQVAGFDLGKSRRSFQVRLIQDSPSTASYPLLRLRFFSDLMHLILSNTMGNKNRQKTNMSTLILAALLLQFLCRKKKGYRRYRVKKILLFYFNHFWLD
jgi:hypothetical protein